MNETPTLYEIRVRGHLAPRRFREFEGLAVAHQPSGDTLVVGPIPDQAALYGLLLWLSNIGVSLLSVRQVEEQTGCSPNSEHVSYRQKGMCDG